MSHNKFMNASFNKFGRISAHRNVGEITEPSDNVETVSPFDIAGNDAMKYSSSFNSAIDNAIPIWEVLRMTEEEYNGVYNPPLPPVVEELKEEVMPPPVVEEVTAVVEEVMPSPVVEEDDGVEEEKVSTAIIS